MEVLKDGEGRTHQTRCPHTFVVPENPQQVVNELASLWTTHIVDLCPERKTVREAPHGHPLEPPPRTKLHKEARGLRDNLRLGQPSTEDLGEAVTAWAEVRNAALKADIPVPMGLDTPELASKEPAAIKAWSDRVDVACTEVMKQCVRNERKARQHSISKKVNNRLAEHILSMEEGGSSSGFLRRAAFNGTTQSKHVQVSLPNGGASTDPEDVLSGHYKVYEDWFAERKAGPGGESGGGRPSIMQLYGGLEGRLHKGKPKCVAYNITMEELRASLRAAPADTCPGPSGISVSHLKLIPDEYLELLCSIFNMILQWGLTPDIFNLGYIFPIPKKGTFTPENSRPISLLEVHLKLLTRIVNRRLVHSLLDEGYFSDTQFGFLAGRSCPDAFHILLGAIEDAAERQREIHLCLVA